MKRILLLCFMLMSIFVSEVWAQDRAVSGKITSSEDGSPLPGVNVVLKGTTVGTVTDINGAYSISVPSSGGTLVFSFIGLETQEIEIGSRAVIDVALAVDSKQLSEIVVVGYGTQERKELTGSVVSIDNSRIETLVAPSFDSQLAGRAAGVQVTTPGGILGQRPIIRIRGVNSLTSSSDPLIVVDGVPMVTSDRSSVVDSNPLANINPADIQSYEVLKDGSATAIYGSRAANGVILITTKRGAKGAAKVNYNGSVGFNEEVSRFDLLNGSQFVEIANEKRTNAGATPLAVDGGVNSDWQDYIFRKGLVQQHNLGISGGSDATSYFFSLGYSGQESPILANDLTRYSFRANVDHKIADRIKIGTNLSYVHTELNGLNNGANSLSGAVYNASRMLPNVAILDPENLAFDGFNVQPDGSTLGFGSNLAGPDNNIPNIAFVLANNVYRNRVNRLFGTAFGELEIVDGLAFRTQIGTDLTIPSDFLSWDPRHGDGRGRDGYAFMAHNPAYQWNFQNTLNYQKTLADAHSLNVTLGLEYQKTTYSSFTATGQGFPDRHFQQYNLISNAASVQNIGGSYAERGFDSYFGRLNYGYKGKYLLSLSARNDGISDLAEENRRGTFTGGSIGWRISEEDFFQSTLFSDLKIRASYAEVGNTEIGTLPYAGGFGAVLYGPDPGIAFSRISNNILQWEVSRKTNIGLNTTIGPVSIEADYFINKIDDMVLDRPVAPSLGVPGGNHGEISENVGSMTNKGFELRVASQVLESNKFRWNTDFNISFIKNEVTNLISPLSGGTTNRTEVGRSVAELYGFQWAGVNPENGNPMYYKEDGSIVQYNLAQATADRGWKTYNPNSPGDVSTAAAAPSAPDMAFLGNTLPKWMGGWTNQFSYGGFDLEIFTRFSGGNYIMNETLRGLMGQGFANNHASILDRWTESGQQTDVPKLFSGSDATVWQTGASNSRFVEKGDFVRIQNIVLGYSVPSEALNNTFKGNVSSVRIFAQIQNPFTFTSYSGLDPELNQYSNQLQFGIDYNNAPIIRTYSMGVSVGF